MYYSTSCYSIHCLLFVTCSLYFQVTSTLVFFFLAPNPPSWIGTPIIVKWSWNSRFQSSLRARINSVLSIYLFHVSIKHSHTFPCEPNVLVYSCSFFFVFSFIGHLCNVTNSIHKYYHLHHVCPCLYSCSVKMFFSYANVFNKHHLLITYPSLFFACNRSPLPPLYFPTIIYRYSNSALTQHITSLTITLHDLILLPSASLRSACPLICDEFSAHGVATISPLFLLLFLLLYENKTNKFT